MLALGPEARLMPHDGKPRPAPARMVFMWYRMVSIVPGPSSRLGAAASRRRRDAVGATRGVARSALRRAALVGAPAQG